ncbi:MAG: hypothetical protein SF052_08275 [Bacteroidia bacterium]|nr:hypothetical protein [Bacteroidia bacterium]
MKILKYTAIVLAIVVGLVLLLITIGAIAAHEPKPEGKVCAEAGEMATQLMAAVDCVAWDTTGAVSWSYGGRNNHLWDREREYDRVRWGDYEVLVNLNTQQGVAFKKGEKLEGEKAEKAVHQAWLRWVNDSFWLNPLCKLYDPGTVRSLVKLKDGRTGMMVTFQSGGATPGDSYVWLADSTGLPFEWKIWVQILPVGGVSFSWEGWEEMGTGAKISTLHKAPLGVELRVKDLKAAATFQEMTGGQDPFQLLDEKGSY